MLKSFGLLVALNLADALLTVAEAARVGLPAQAIEANPVAAWALAYGLTGLLVLKVLPLAVLGVLMHRRPLVAVVTGLVLVFAGVLAYHGLLVASWFA